MHLYRPIIIIIIVIIIIIISPLGPFGSVTGVPLPFTTSTTTTTTTTTYLLTLWSRVLLGKLTGFQLVKKFPAFYGTRKFITAFTSARHLSLSQYQSRSEAFCVNIS